MVGVPSSLPGVQDCYDFNELLTLTNDGSCFSRSLHELHRLDKADTHAVLHQLARLERKAFPSHEAFPFDSKLVKQPNASVIFLTDDALHPLTRPIQAYAVCVRFRGAMLLHKICVAEFWRRKGLGKHLMGHIILRAQSMSCRSVELWVCESRTAARRLYSKCGFSETQSMQDYYSVGRHAIKMVLSLES